MSDKSDYLDQAIRLAQELIVKYPNDEALKIALEQLEDLLRIRNEDN